MKRKIQRFLGLGPCWHSISNYFVRKSSPDGLAECSLCEARVDIHDI